MAPKPTQPKKMQFEKYSPFIPVVLTDRTWPNNVTTKAPLWCSVDLRDGNQALIDPMDSERNNRSGCWLCCRCHHVVARLPF